MEIKEKSTNSEQIREEHSDTLVFVTLCVFVCVFFKSQNLEETDIIEIH